MTDPNFHIETPRLYLSYFMPRNDQHCDFLVRLYNTPEFIASHGGTPTAITTAAAARQRLEGRFRAEHARNGYGTYLVSLKPDAGASSAGAPSFAEALADCEPIGSVSLMRGDTATSYKAPDIGYAIISEEAGKGYATEAARGLIEYARQNLGIDAVFGFFQKGNTRSRRVVQKLGFEDRGVRALKAFGGAESEVWALPGMDADLAVYAVD